MAKIAYVMLAHEAPEQVADHARIITNADPTGIVYVHYDRRAPAEAFRRVLEALAGESRILPVAARVDCRWGTFGLVEAVLNALAEIARRADPPDHVYLISGSCLPIRPLAELKRYLDEHAGIDFIQAEDENWITGGLKSERWQFYFPIGRQENRRLFDLSVKAQRRLGIRRAFPDDLRPRFGSQWWCLTWRTCAALLARVAERPDLVRFFRTVWIPDECFFQTLVADLVPPGRRIGKTLTLYKFGATGKPLVFFDDHESWLFGRNFFFARKIAPEAKRLVARSRAIAAAPDSGVALDSIGGTTPFFEEEIERRIREEPPGQVFRQHAAVGSGATIGATGPLAFVRPLRRAWLKSFGLRPLIDRTADIQLSDIILVCCERNEAARLPFLFDYYRRIGVGHFLVVDNDSNDGSREWLAAQPDCSLWHTRGSYRDAAYGMDWCNALLRRHGTGHWCLTVDADEFLVYPFMETRSLSALCRFLDDDKRRSFPTLTIDAYADRPLGETVYSAGDDPFEVCPYFDASGYSEQPRSEGSTCIQGGLRLRLHDADRPESAPALNKVPLVKWRATYHYRDSTHHLRPAGLNQTPREALPATGCLFQFKLIASLIGKAEEEGRRRQHYQHSAEYDRYGATGDLNPYKEGLSVRYRSPEQLVALGLMSPGRWF